MKCSVHADQSVIMVCREKQCKSCFVCVLCIAGAHTGHKMTTIEEAGKGAKKRLQDKSKENVKYVEDQKRKMKKFDRMEKTNNKERKELRQKIEAQRKMMYETVDKVIAHMIIQCDKKYEERLGKLEVIRQRTRNNVATVQSSEDSLKQILETEDWLQIIQHEKKSAMTPKVEDLPEDTTPDIGTEEIGNVLVKGVLLALQQCKSPSSTTADEDASDFEGTVYRQKSLQSVSSFSLGHDHDIRCVVASKTDQLLITVLGQNEIYICNKQGVVIKRLKCKKEPRDLVITDDSNLLVSFCDQTGITRVTGDGKQLDIFSTDPLMPNKLCIARNGDIFVTLVSSFTDPLQDIVGAVSRYTPQGKRMITFERDRFGNTICPKYIVASRISDMVVITTLTNSDSDGWFYGHVIVMNGDLQVKFRYLSDGRVIPGDEKYSPCTSNKHFTVAIDSQDNIILGDLFSGCIEIIDKHGHKLQSLGQVDGLGYLTVSNEKELCIGKKDSRVEIFKYT